MANMSDPTRPQLIYDQNGKKLSNKERKKIIKAREAAARAAEYEGTAAKASAEGAQFACSQTAVNVNDPQWQNSLDINIPSFNISAAGKILFKDAQFNIAHSRRYGLVGPNGKGKSTLLKMIASRDMVLPPRVDFLYVEQEVRRTVEEGSEFMIGSFLHLCAPSNSLLGGGERHSCRGCGFESR